MKQVTVYRILTFILVPFAALFGFMDLFMLVVALSNPPLLLFVFVATSFVIYTVVSLRFLTSGIDTGRRCTTSLRDWIRVNAYVASFMAIIMLVNTFFIETMGNSALREFAAKFLESQPNNTGRISEQLVVTMVRGMAWFFMVLGLTLAIHIRMTFSLLKKYASLFDAPAE